MNAILDDLTPAQREAAIQSGPVLVIAGAGTGKTKTLTAAVAHRIADCGMPAEPRYWPSPSPTRRQPR